MSNGQERPLGGFTHNDAIEQALDQSTRELEILANVYHQRGHTERAHEMYNAIENLRRDRDLRDSA